MTVSLIQLRHRFEAASKEFQGHIESTAYGRSPKRRPLPHSAIRLYSLSNRYKILGWPICRVRICLLRDWSNAMT